VNPKIPKDKNHKVIGPKNLPTNAVPFLHQKQRDDNAIAIGTIKVKYIGCNG
jgi:hypothetical protein